MITSDTKYLELLERVYGHHITPYENPMDIMNVGTREFIDVELIADCDDREDFLQLRSLERTVENFKKEEYGIL